MNRLKTVYAGLKLKNPIVISSSGLTNSPERILNLEKAGAGAVVLKSLFEEQIDLLMNQYSGYNEYPEAMDYVRAYSENHSISEYTQLIRDSKSLCTIPVIASIHCYSDGSWTSYAEYIEKAGADAIELNISVMNTGRNPIDVEELHVQIVRSVKSKIKIPVIVKLGANFTNLIPLIERLKGAGATAVVLFNRFYQPDININKQTFSAGNVFSNAQDIHHTLRWTSIVTGVLPEVEVSASTGIHDWESAIKVLLSGATTVQLCSAVYEQGDVIISQISTCIEEWMVQKGYHHIEEFRGKLNYKNIANPSMYERMQFMKYFAEKE
jgi:dihydroorotate dehydrogenase (fumarate)